MQMPSYSQIAAAGRHGLTIAATIVGTLATLHLISGDQAGKVSDALSQIGTGLASVATGVGTLVGIGSALYAAWTASKSSQIASVAAMPDVQKIVTTSPMTAALPSEKVVLAAAPVSIKPAA
jgi:hypothetical protein